MTKSSCLVILDQLTHVGGKNVLLIHFVAIQCSICAALLCLLRLGSNSYASNKRTKSKVKFSKWESSLRLS